MKIGIAGPISTDIIAPYLADDATSLPIGYKGAPLLGTLIGELLARGHQVSAYTTSSDLSPDLTRPVIAQGERFKIYYCPARKHSIRMNGRHLGRIVDFFRLERRFLKQAILEDNPDVVHAHWAYEFALAAIESGKPHVVTCHDAPQEILKYMPNMYRLGRYFMALKAMRTANRLTTVSPYLHSKLSSLVHNAIEIIPNPLPAAMTGISLDHSRSLSCQAPVVVMVANGWSRYKNIPAGFLAFAQLRARIGAARLRLYGAGFGEGEEAHKWARQRGLTENVEFLGCLPYPTLLQEIAKADVFLHPALEESFGMVVAEAMALGVPVIGGKASGAVPWVIGDAGILVDVTDATEIAHALTDILTNPERWLALRNLAQTTAKSRFSAESVATAYEKIYIQQLDKS